MEKKDLVIIGAGPAGFSASIYAARYDMDVLIIGQVPGGIASTAHDIRNFPAFEQITGMELMMKMMAQSKSLGVELRQTLVKDISKTDEGFLIKTDKDEILAQKIIVATGTSRRALGIAREKELVGKGVSYCATCDAGFYKDRVACVIGGGDAALTAALLLKKFATKVYIIYRKSEFTKAEVAWIKEIKASENIETIFNTEVEELIGKEKLEKIKLNNGQEIETDGLFIEIGGSPNARISQELDLELDKNGAILVDKDQKTNIDGIFAAGDVTDRPFKQIISACGDAATACFTAFKQLRKEAASK